MKNIRLYVCGFWRRYRRYYRQLTAAGPAACKPGFLRRKNVFALRKSVFALHKSVFALRKSVFALRKSVFALGKNVFAQHKPGFLIKKPGSGNTGAPAGVLMRSPWGGRRYPEGQGPRPCQK
jgi:hypothetical protein